MSETKHTAIAVVQSAVPERVHPVVAQMLALNPDPSTLRELLAIQREWEAGEAKREFTTALVSLKRNLPSVISRDAKVKFTSKTTGETTEYTHATLANILEQTEEHLVSFGFTLTWVPSVADKGLVQVTCVLTHEGGHSQTCALAAPPDTSGKKDPTQAIASTVTRLQRYTACSLLGITTKDMQEAAECVPDDDAIDSAKTMIAAAWLRTERGINRDEAELFLGDDAGPKPIDRWTLADLAAIKAKWGKASAREPGDDG